MKVIITSITLNLSTSLYEIGKDHIRNATVRSKLILFEIPMVFENVILAQALFQTNLVHIHVRSVQINHLPNDRTVALLFLTPVSSSPSSIPSFHVLVAERYASQNRDV